MHLHSLFFKQIQTHTHTHTCPGFDQHQTEETTTTDIVTLAATKEQATSPIIHHFFVVPPLSLSLHTKRPQINSNPLTNHVSVVVSSSCSVCVCVCVFSAAFSLSFVCLFPRPKILLLGAGFVAGPCLDYLLCREENEITVGASFR